MTIPMQEAASASTSFFSFKTKVVIALIIGAFVALGLYMFFRPKEPLTDKKVHFEEPVQENENTDEPVFEIEESDNEEEPCEQTFTAEGEVTCEK